MSRTRYKRKETFKQYWSNWRFDEEGGATSSYGYYFTPEEMLRNWVKHHYRSAKYFDYKLPRHFRNYVNRRRRANDRQELWRELNNEDYAGNYSKWNCKDANHWGYW